MQKLLTLHGWVVLPNDNVFVLLIVPTEWIYSALFTTFNQNEMRLMKFWVLYHLLICAVTAAAVPVYSVNFQATRTLCSWGRKLLYCLQSIQTWTRDAVQSRSTWTSRRPAWKDGNMTSMQLVTTVSSHALRTALLRKLTPVTGWKWSLRTVVTSRQSAIAKHVIVALFHKSVLLEFNCVLLAVLHFAFISVSIFCWCWSTFVMGQQLFHQLTML